MWEIAHIIGISQILLLAAFFLKNRRSPGNLPLALFLLSLAPAVAVAYLYETRKILSFPYPARMGFPLVACLGVWYYLALREQIRRRPLGIKDALLFAVPLGEIVYLLPFFFSSAETKLEYLKGDLLNIHLDCQVMYWLGAGNTLLFLLFALTLRPEPRSSGDSEIPENLQRYYRRLRFYTGGLLSALVLWGLLSLYEPNTLNDGMAAGVISLLMFALAADKLYFSRSNSTLDFLQPPQGKYEKSLLVSDEVELLALQVRELLEKEKLYLEPEIGLKEIAARINAPPNKISQAVNRKFSKSLPDLINEYRAREAAVRLEAAEFDEFPILRIALDCGFNAKSTFNRIFSRDLGVSPSKYRARAREKRSRPSG